MEELIGTEPLTLAFLMRANWLCNEPLLAWDRYNPIRQRFTRNQLVNTSSPRLEQPLSVWDGEPAFEQLRRPSFASDPGGSTSSRQARGARRAIGGSVACWGAPWAWVRMELMKSMLRALLPAKIRAYVRDYCKRNGLLTLSVIAVVTGCLLGFLLRSLNLSTQVRTRRWAEVRRQKRQCVRLGIGWSLFPELEIDLERRASYPLEGKKPHILLIDALDKASYVTVMLAALRRSSRKASLSDSALRKCSSTTV